jgi:DNA-binding IclR family transcriptional regulator
MALQGAQVVARIGRVLRIVSESSTRGISTAALARQAELTRPTAHRLLVSLALEGFVDHNKLFGTWVLGPELFLMGSVAAARYDITAIAAPSVRALAEQTGESAFLSARRGDETVCLLREDGSFPLRSFVLYEGVRFPLGVASAGMAIIAYLSDPEIADYLDGHDLEAERGPVYARASILERVALTRKTGWATNPGLILEGSWGMGAAIFDRGGHPIWALSITGVESRFTAERQGELGKRLLEHAHKISQLVQSRAG